jgi:hypothetical protein
LDDRFKQNKAKPYGLIKTEWTYEDSILPVIEFQFNLVEFDQDVAGEPITNTYHVQFAKSFEDNKALFHC